MKNFRVLVLVMTALVSAGTAYGQELTARGMTEPVSDATMGAAVNGTVASILRKEGDAVEKGDVIVELDISVEKLEVERRKLVADSKSKLNAAQSRVETLRIDYESTLKLFETTKSVSKDDLQKKELEYKLAQAELAGIEMEEDRELLEYQMAKAQLDRKRVRAPFDGVVVKVFMDVGENCNPQQPLVRVVDVDKCYFTAHVDASLPWGLSAGSKVALSIQDASGLVKKEGKVEFVSPVVDPSSGLQEVRALFDNADGAVRPGANGTMTVVRND